MERAFKATLNQSILALNVDGVPVELGLDLSGKIMGWAKDDCP